MVKTSNYQSRIKTLLRSYVHISHSNGTRRVMVAELCNEEILDTG
jgi:hypothetical protein